MQFVLLGLLSLLWWGAPSLAATVADVEPLAQQAIKAVERGDFATSEDFWGQILAINPANAAVWSNRGNVRLSQNNIEGAIADFNRSIELAPDIADPYLNRGVAFERAKDWDKAIADYDRVIAISPQDAYAYNNRGNAYGGRGDWEKALGDYEQAVRLDPKFAFARANSALARYQLGEDDQALKEIKGLVRKYPNFADMRAALTAILWHQQKRGEAESNWVAVMGLDDRYKDLDWVANIRRWSPRLVGELGEFLQFK